MSAQDTDGSNSPTEATPGPWEQLVRKAMGQTTNLGKQEKGLAKALGYLGCETTDLATFCKLAGTKPGITFKDQAAALDKAGFPLQHISGALSGNR